jgi:hypothetical protein
MMQLNDNMRKFQFFLTPPFLTDQDLFYKIASCGRRRAEGEHHLSSTYLRLDWIGRPTDINKLFSAFFT